jgi:hypothetical protein
MATANGPFCNQGFEQLRRDYVEGMQKYCWAVDELMLYRVVIEDFDGGLIEKLIVAQHLSDIDEYAMCDFRSAELLGPVELFVENSELGGIVERGNMPQ